MDQHVTAKEKGWWKITHRGTHTREYRVWADMMQRCTNPKNARFHKYGGRGITVCTRWSEFASFLEDMGPRPSPHHSIDRIDNDGNYEPSNCRWATRSEQQRNKSPVLDTSRLPHGDDHWTRKDRARAVAVARANIKRTHNRGELNNNAKMTRASAQALRSAYESDPSIDLAELGSRFGVGRETARKIIRGLAWQ